MPTSKELMKVSRHLTGNLITAGFHEVVCNQATLAAMERQKQENPGRPLVRISSTFFYHLSPEELIEPLPELEHRRVEFFAKDTQNTVQQKAYPRMAVGELVQRWRASHLHLDRFD